MILNLKDLKTYTRKGKLGIEIYVVNKRETGVTAYFKEFPNIVTQGETIKEAQTNLWNAIFNTLKYFTRNTKIENKT